MRLDGGDRKGYRPIVSLALESRRGSTSRLWSCGDAIHNRPQESAHQQVYPDRISPKCVPQVDLPNTREARESKLFQSSRMEINTPPQHDG